MSTACQDLSWSDRQGECQGGSGRTAVSWGGFEEGDRVTWLVSATTEWSREPTVSAITWLTRPLWRWLLWYAHRGWLGWLGWLGWNDFDGTLWVMSWAVWGVTWLEELTKHRLSWFRYLLSLSDGLNLTWFLSVCRCHETASNCLVSSMYPPSSLTVSSRDQRWGAVFVDLVNLVRRQLAQVTLVWPSVRLLWSRDLVTLWPHVTYQTVMWLLSWSCDI